MTSNMEERMCLVPSLAQIKLAFPHFKFTVQRRAEPLHVWLNRMANQSKDHPEWDYQIVNGKWRCTFYMKDVVIASCCAAKKRAARSKATEMALENLGVVCNEREISEKAGGRKVKCQELPKQAERVAVPEAGKVKCEELPKQAERVAVPEAGKVKCEELPKQAERVAVPEAAVQQHEGKGKEATDELSESSVEQNILDIQRKILANQIRISDSVKRIVGCNDTEVRNSNPEDPCLSYYNTHVVRVENSIIMKQNIILGCVGSFSVSQNVKHGCEFKKYEEQCIRISQQSEILGNINKSKFQKLGKVKEESYLTKISEELKRYEPLAVNPRMVGERWYRIIENQSIMLDNQLEIMCALTGMTPDIGGRFDLLNVDNHACFLGNVTTTYRYKIFFHENEISSMLNDVMSIHHKIVDDQKKIFENEGKISKAFNSCVFSKDFVHEMTGRVPFLDNELYALQLKTWAGMNHLLAKLNQVYMDRLDNLCGHDDMVNYQSEILANQKNMLANLSRFPGTQNAIQDNQSLILCVQNEVLTHYIPAVKDNEPLGEDNIGFQLLKSLGWSGGGLGSHQQGIAEPVRAEGCIGRNGLGYQNPRKRGAPKTSVKMDLENLRTKFMKSKECAYVPLVGTLPASIAPCPSSEMVDTAECITLD